MKRENKRGQVTLFVIMAIVIVAVGVIGYFVYQNYQKTKELSATEIASVKTYLQETVAYEVDSSLILIGLQGGYSDYPEKFLQMQYHFISYYYYNKKINVLSHAKLSDELKKEITRRISEIELSSNFTGIEIQKSQPKIEVNTSIKVTLPVTIKKDKSQALVEIRYERENAHFDKILNISNAIAKNVSAEPGKVNLEMIFELQQNYGVAISPLIYNENTIIYRIADNETMIDENIFEFYFAVENV